MQRAYRIEFLYRKIRMSQWVSRPHGMLGIQEKVSLWLLWMMEST